MKWSKIEKGGNESTKGKKATTTTPKSWQYVLAIVLKWAQFSCIVLDQRYKTHTKRITFENKREEIAQHESNKKNKRTTKYHWKMFMAFGHTFFSLVQMQFACVRLQFVLIMCYGFEASCECVFSCLLFVPFLSLFLVANVRAILFFFLHKLCTFWYRTLETLYARMWVCAAHKYYYIDFRLLFICENYYYCYVTTRKASKPEKTGRQIRLKKKCNKNWNKKGIEKAKTKRER